MKKSLSNAPQLQQSHHEIENMIESVSLELSLEPVKIQKRNKPMMEENCKFKVRRRDLMKSLFECNNKRKASNMQIANIF